MWKSRWTAPHPSTRLGSKPQGIIIVHARRIHVGAVGEAWGRFVSGDWFKGTDEEYRAEVSSYIAYTGPFQVDEDKKTLTHSMFVSLFPDWAGQTQPRVVRLEGDKLHLSTQSPIKSGGKTVNSRLVWRRAERQ